MLADCDLLIFDCDGVLVDSETLAVLAFVSVLEDAGVAATRAMVERCFGMKQADVLTTLAAETGRALPPSIARDLWPATRRAFERSLRPMPGVEAFLARMPPIKRCVASSSNPERIAVSLRLTGLGDTFGDAVFSSHQVVSGKPAPDLFLFAAAAMGADPSRCLVIEDSIYGVQAARAAGMIAAGFVGGSHIAPGHAETLRAAGADMVESSWAAMGARLLGP